jgi:hypothetical protein
MDRLVTAIFAVFLEFSEIRISPTLQKAELADHRRTISSRPHSIEFAATTPWGACGPAQCFCLLPWLVGPAGIPNPRGQGSCLCRRIC